MIRAGACRARPFGLAGPDAVAGQSGRAPSRRQAFARVRRAFSHGGGPA